MNTQLILFFTSITLLFNMPFLHSEKKVPLQQATPQVIVLTPQSGQVLQGTTPINIQTDIVDIISVEVTFGYEEDPTQTWFLIFQEQGEFDQSFLFQWDTSTLTDGNYAIKVNISTKAKKQYQVIVKNLRVRNYSPIETNTPTPITPTSTPDPAELPSATPTATTTVTVTSTSLPTNPVEISSPKIVRSLGVGLITAIFLLSLLGIYLIMRDRRSKGD